MQVGPYQVLEEIARGGMGAVYRARAANGAAVALKLILPQHASSPRTRQRFRSELRALARLRHPNIVSILDAGEHGGSPWIALDYVAGESLGQRLRRGPLPVTEAIEVALDLTNALSYVHSCGVLHRDLKPDNVLLRGGRALLTDFGLVLDDQSSVSRITHTGIFQGTPGYWAPEQAAGRVNEFGPATDVYGLGAVIYACLTGRPPIAGDSLQQILKATEEGRIVPPRDLRPDAPVWVCELCLSCLASAPSDRPQSATEVGRSLLLGHKTTAKRPRDSTLAIWAVAAALVVGLVLLAQELGGTTVPATPAPATAPPKARPEPPLAGSSEDESSQRLALAVTLIKSGKVHAQEGRHVQAIEAYDRAIELAPGEPAPHLLRGLAMFELEGPEAAIPDFSAAIALDPRQPDAYLRRGACHAKLQRQTEAITDYGRAIALDPQNPNAFAKRATSFAKLNQHAEAVADLGRAIELAPRSSSFYSNRGVSLAHLGRHAEAIADYDRALEFGPDDVVTYSNRAQSRRLLGRYAAAIADYTKTLELDPSNASAYSNRGTCRLAMGQPQAALLDYERGLELAPDDAVLNVNRGVSLAKLERYDEALRAYNRALRLELEPERVEQVLRARAEVEAKLATRRP